MIKVLVVEDDPMVSRLHETYIGQLDGYKMVHASSNGEDALGFLNDHTCDLVILDVYMPGMDGMELLHQIREKKYDVDIIMISAAHDRERILAALRQGVFDYIIKPFEFERFSLALNNYRQRFTICHKDGLISQSDLDYSLLNRNKNVSGKVPKGLERNTLHKVWTEVLRIEGNFTTEDIAKIVGISRVSIRKYLDFLKSINILYLELNRGSVGRPVYKYKCVNKNPNLINAYLDK